MRVNKGIFRTTVALVASLLLAGQVGAMTLIGSGNVYSKLGIDSEITVGTDLSVNDAAMRLYYLGILNGSGTNINGGVEFALGRGLNRVEAAVFAVRFLGAEGEALALHPAHPFTDVPSWASDYVGYIYSCGLLCDIDGELFEPSKAETAERFMSYVLYALGYRIEEKDYTYFMAAEYARGVGICTTAAGEPLTRGGAVEAMYNALRSTVKDSSRVYSDVLVERGAISYKDAIFLLWNCDREETEAYMEAVGYGTEWVIPDGFYKIRAHESGKMLNVAVDGKNHDYEGVPVTLWAETHDVSQTFRLERTERGTYYIYSAASRNGYGRVIGTYNGETVGLYSPTGQWAEEFYINGDANGNWTITSAENSDLLLSCLEPNSDGNSIVFENSTARDAVSLTWEFERQGFMNSDGKELAIFVADSLRVTQGAYDTYSHQRQNAVDIAPTEYAVFAPFNATIVRIDASYTACNAVWIQSTSEVLFADGTYDYMTALFMHDNDIDDLYVGLGIPQGTYFYDAGDYGVSAGKHVHLALYRGKYNSSMRLGCGDVYAEDALFLPDTTYIYDDYGLEWKLASLAD